MPITLNPIATVTNSRKTSIDDNWSEIISEIILSDDIPEEAFNNISQFSHLEIIYFFDKVNDDAIVFSGRPRGNPAYPLMGIFAQRKKDRPNRIGLCTVTLVSHHERTLRVKNLDAIDGTPILDIKPVFKSFQPEGTITEPSWVAELMKNYW
ncbi:MAG: SAM-dependent methyltransferase [Agriterribacter sp.]